jgi:hypothetical protein
MPKGLEKTIERWCVTPLKIAATGSFSPLLGRVPSDRIAVTANNPKALPAAITGRLVDGNYVVIARHSRDRSFVVLGENRTFVLVMAAGSIAGSFIGGLLLGLVPSPVLLSLLAVILVFSAIKVWKHK